MKSDLKSCAETLTMPNDHLNFQNNSDHRNPRNLQAHVVSWQIVCCNDNVDKFQCAASMSAMQNSLQAMLEIARRLTRNHLVARSHSFINFCSQVHRWFNF